MAYTARVVAKEHTVIERRVLPNQVPMKWQAFTKWAPPFSISLDGFVSGPPQSRVFKRGPYRNLNHHEGVPALETRATCAQAQLLIRQGLLEEVFTEKGNPRAVLFENDCDEDVCVSDFCLMNPHLVRATMNPLLNKLVHIEDMLDITAGSYRFPTDMLSLKETKWIFEPYNRFRASGELDKRNAISFESIIVDVGHRIMQYLTGHGKTIDLDPRYKVIGGGEGWQMIKAVGLHATQGAFADGHRALVVVRERPDGRFVYSLLRSADFVASLPIDRILKAANAAEGCVDECWGGRTTAAGSPRVSGSKLNPDELTKLVEDCKLRGRTR